MTRPVVTSTRQARLRPETTFTEALRQAVLRVPGGRGAVFLDGEGEAVDEFAEVPTTEIRIMGAHLGILMALVRELAPKIGEPLELTIEATRGTVVVMSIGDRYVVALEAAPDAPLGIVRRELARAVDTLRSAM